MDLGLRSDDRLLILGSSGWFGHELRALLERVNCPAEVLPLPGPSSGQASDLNSLRTFNPTIVVNFAFLTRERVDSEGEQIFRQINTELTERFLCLAESLTVRLAITVSSGAAVTEARHPYGQLKAVEESSTLALADLSRAAVVLRAYSVSGPYVRRPHAYAFSDLILQAMSGRVHVYADRPVIRRYVSVQDALMVALACGSAGKSGVLETGGEIVDVRDLARRVVEVVNPVANVSHADQVSDQPNRYCSDNRTWLDWVVQSGVRPLTLSEQIQTVANGLRARLQ